MSRSSALLLILLLAPLLVLLPSCGWLGAPSDDPAAHDHASETYTCPMHPEIVRDQPGSCPICGMDLAPVGETSGSDPTVVHVEPGLVQRYGVQTRPVERTTVFRHLRTIGDVEVGEDEVGVVNLRVSGWVERLRVEVTGEEVSRGQVLFDLYSPELVAAQEELLLAIRSQGADSTLARAARRRLELWDVASVDIDAIIRKGEASRNLPVRAPRSGFVLHKDLVSGARVAAGQDLYRIGDLRRIWVAAEIYEHDAPWVEVGQPAQMELTHLPGEVLEGQVAYIYPTLDPKTRTLRVRLEFENPGVRLKPGMFATVTIEYRRKDDVIAVPTSAVLQTGRRAIVFVTQGEGRFAPREVRTGLVGDHRMTEVVEGLEAGEEVVVSGQFLLDAEAQLQEAVAKMRDPDRAAEAEGAATVWSCPMHPEVISDSRDRCPECGMYLEQRPATVEELREVAAQGSDEPLYTCPMHPMVVQPGPGRCPDCGMFLVPLEEDSDAPHAHDDDGHEGHEHGEGAP